MSGTGGLGSPGVPQQPSSFELEATASQQLNRAALGIIPDSIEQIFTEANARYNAGYLGGFGYKASAETPLLDHPLESTRMAQTSTTFEDVALAAAYNSLVDSLPEDIQASLQADPKTLPFVALDNVLTVAARLLARSQILSQPAAPESLEEMRTALNVLLPFAALKGSLDAGNEIVESARNFVTEQGANYPYFDGLNEALNELQGPLGLLGQVDSNLTPGSGLNLSPEIQRAAGQAAAQLVTMSNQLQSVSLGNDLQVLQPTFQTLGAVAASLSLPNTGSAPLYLALTLALTGINSSESSTGVIGPSLDAVMNALISGFLAGPLEELTPAGQSFFSMLLKASYTAIIGLSGLAVQNGLGFYPTSEETDAAQYFAFELATELTISSDLLGELFIEVMSASGENDPATNGVSSSVLAQIASLLVILTGAQEGGQPPSALIAAEEDYLNKGLVSAQELLEQIQTEQNALAATAAIALQQSQIALQERDYEQFLDAYVNVMESLNTSPTALFNDLNTIAAKAKMMATVISQGNSDQNLTNIIHVV